MRLFIAVLFDDETVERLAEIRDRLHEAAVYGSFVPRENLHLTLEFLGECGRRECESAIDAMNEIECSPFPVIMDHIGAFRRPDGDIWWIGAEESGPLMRLQRNLHDALKRRGLQLERRRYRPHITLARRVTGALPERKIEPAATTAAGFDLMLSERGEGRMIYSSLYHRELSQTPHM